MKKITLFLTLSLTCFLSVNAQNNYPPTGPVGLGTNSALSELQVEGSNSGGEIGITIKNRNPFVGTRAVIDFITTSTSTKYGSMGVEHTANGQGAMTFSTRGGTFEKMRITTNGKIGMGTTNPLSRLHVQDSNSGGEAGITIKNNNAVVGTRSVIDFITTTSSTKYGSMGVEHTSSGRGAMIFSTRGSTGLIEKMRIMPDGNVGIGHPDPQNELDVNGTVHAREVRVDLTGFPDFVFYDYYNLPTLKAVEQHIKKKGHLQDIPSAAEVEKNGINLGEMDAKLLQKIEELMLYTIQQQKELDKLKSQNKKYLEIQERLKKLESGK